jgi:biotin carboxylase
LKKILLLGGSTQQVVAIETAKRLGYDTVLCDYLTDNPGQYQADKFYLISTTDKEAILKVAIQEKIDGILAYASDPAAPTAAYVAEKLGLQTSPYGSVETLCNKDRFREFLRANGFNAPQSGGYENPLDVKADIGKYTLPIIIKPVDSSGSKGATVLHDLNGLDTALKFAFSFSRSHRIIMEEFIEKKHKYLIGGDIFVENGKIILWGLLNCHRDNNVNPLVPVGKSHPVELEDGDLEQVKETLQRMVDKLHMTSCGMNVELIIDKDGKVWPIDVGPRNGGNMIPDLLGMIYGVDVVEMAVKAAMGEPVHIEPKESKAFYATHNLHATQSGIYYGIDYSKELEKHIVKKCEYKKKGDRVEYFDNAAKALGIIFLKFDTQEEMHNMLDHINEYIHIKFGGGIINNRKFQMSGMPKRYAA